MYVAWKGANRLFTKWHIWDPALTYASSGTYTLCGKIAPLGFQSSEEKRKKAQDTCRTCREREKRENGL